MKTIILCGGLGTRIRGVDESVPKPMLRIGTQPILWHIMKYISMWGHQEFILCLGYQGHVIKEFFKNYKFYMTDSTIKLGDSLNPFFHEGHDERDWVVTLSETGVQSGTATRISKIKKYIGEDEDFILTYGDGVANVDVNKLISFHKKNKKLLTVTGINPPGRFGEIEFDHSNTVTKFHEKPNGNNFISGGYFICDKRIFSYFDNEDASFEEVIIPRIVEDGEMAVYCHDDKWSAMDTYKDYLYLNELYESGKAFWKIW
ncbi:sugar phosphate nucleotidyltransferase [Paenibacillus xylanexedens]|uniref:sugar phosphate nucleotidyltransferase n=1 Tax=Paenibacillus xylanexedens TaxID=528191 RepID=UPI003D0378DF